MGQQAIFICGSGHCGTSLIANILAAHPDAHVPLRESHIFVGGRDTAGPLRALLAEGERSGKPVLVEKTPAHIRHMDLIRFRVPGARFVIPVRDGRDVVASFVKRGVSAGDAVRRWIKDTTITVAERSEPDVLVYRHEDLITDTADTIRSVCEFAGLTFTDDLLRYHEEERQWFGADAAKLDKHRQHRNWQINQPIFDSRGRWVGVVDEDDLRPLYASPGSNLMRALGYLGAGEEHEVRARR